jgi:hypothetical protein
MESITKRRSPQRNFGEERYVGFCGGNFFEGKDGRKRPSSLLRRLNTAVSGKPESSKHRSPHTPFKKLLEKGKACFLSFGASIGGGGRENMPPQPKVAQ